VGGADVLRFPLSLRNVENLLFEREIAICQSGQTDNCAEHSVGLIGEMNKRPNLEGRQVALSARYWVYSAVGVIGLSASADRSSASAGRANLRSVNRPIKGGALFSG
jgi:hypothetical protein